MHGNDKYNIEDSRLPLRKKWKLGTSIVMFYFFKKKSKANYQKILRSDKARFCERLLSKLFFNARIT